MGEPVGPRTVYDWALVLFHLSVWGVLVYAVIAKGLAPPFRKIAEESQVEHDARHRHEQERWELRRREVEALERIARSR